MAKWECKSCGHIGYSQWVHNDEKCEKCYSGQIVEITKHKKESYRLRIDNCSLYVLTHPYYYAKKWVTTCGGLFLFEHLKSDNLEDAKVEAVAFFQKFKDTHVPKSIQGSLY